MRVGRGRGLNMCVCVCVCVCVCRLRERGRIFKICACGSGFETRSTLCDRTTALISHWV